MNRKIYMFIASASFLILLFFVGLLFFKNTSSHNPPPREVILKPTPNTSSSTVNTRIIVPPTLQDVPTIPFTQGGGIDTSSPLIQKSTNAISKLSSFLPYQKNFTSSTNVSVSILVPAQNLQANTWTLKAQVFGIDYQVSTDDPAYPSMKESFREAAGDVFSWVRSHSVDPQNIIFSWGDRAYIQQRAEEWLKYP